MQAVSRTHVGMVRSNNEDALLLREPQLFAVADGMGGYAAGEIASRATLKAFTAATHVLRHGGVREAESLTDKVGIEYVLLQACAKANEHVYKMAQSNAQYEKMGTTLTALYLPGDGAAYAAHIGDSRLYLYRGGVLSCLTHDQSIVGDLLQQGKITPKEAFIHPQRNMLLQAVGVEKEVKPEILHFLLQSDDRLLLCSDGLSDMLRDEEIAAVLAQENDGEAAAQLLLDKALDNGGKDNISLILLSGLLDNGGRDDKTADAEAKGGGQ